MRKVLVLFLLAAGCTTGTSSSSTSSSGSSGNADGGTQSGDGGTAQGVVSEVSPSETLRPVYIKTRSNGNLVMTEGAGKRMVEMTPAGMVVGINSTDWGMFDWPTWLTTDNNGKIYVTAFRKIWLYDNGVMSAKKTWVDVDGARDIDALTWGGANNGTFFMVKNMITTHRVIKYTSPLADAAGTGTDVADINMGGNCKSMVAMPDGTVYAYSSNACRLVRVKPDGTVQTLYGNPTSNVCPVSGSEPSTQELAQGDGMTLRNGKIVFAETATNSLREIDVSTDPPTLRVLARGYAFKDVTAMADGSLWAVEDATFKILKITF